MLYSDLRQFVEWTKLGKGALELLILIMFLQLSIRFRNCFERVAFFISLYYIIKEYFSIKSYN